MLNIKEYFLILIVWSFGKKHKKIIKKNKSNIISNKKFKLNKVKKKFKTTSTKKNITKSFIKNIITKTK